MKKHNICVVYFDTKLYPFEYISEFAQKIQNFSIAILRNPLL